MTERTSDNNALLPIIEDGRQVFECLYLLERISWSDTGLSKMREETSSDWGCPALLTLVDGVLHGHITPANYVLYRLWQRERYLHAQEEFSGLSRSKMTDLSPAQAKEQATASRRHTTRLASFSS